MFTRTLAVLLMAVSIAACKDETTAPGTLIDDAGLPADQIMYQLRHVMTNNGVRTALLVSDSAYVRDADRRLDLLGVDLDFFDTNGRSSGKLTSETGEYDIGSGSFVARGGVVLITTGARGQRRLETEELHYDRDADQLWSDVPFVLTENGQTTRGTSFRSDSEFRNFTIQGAQGGIPGEVIF